jgi:hypothetical protein
MESPQARINNSKKLIRQFNFFTRQMRPVLDGALGRVKAGEMMQQGRREFAKLIPLLPETGSRGLLALFGNVTGMYLAMYRVSLKHGKTLEETGRLIYDTAEYLLRHIPGVLARTFAGMNFSQKYLAALQQSAIESKSGKFSDGYMFDYVAGDGKTFDYGVDYLECASVKFLKKQGAPELAPYLCPIDILYSDTFGWGLHRSMTLADGDAKCDFRFSRGGRTEVKVKVIYPD